MTPTSSGLDLHRVRLVALPLDVMARAQEQHEGLLREFALIANPHPNTDYDVPRRLLDVATALRERFAAFTAEPNALIERAMQRGDRSIDTQMQLPVEAREAALSLAALLEEADDYCRKGELLTLATPPELVTFRRWYLGQIVDQIEGAAPVAWPTWRAAAAS
ncbi:MAG: hypothetical protein H0U48_03845 [Euzebyaceae bacterium]|nr:hypothetical protein [Euzebyaceae bacterium]